MVETFEFNKVFEYYLTTRVYITTQMEARKTFTGQFQSLYGTNKF